MELHETISGLSKELLLNKVDSFASGFTASSDESTKTIASKRYKTFTISNPQAAPQSDKDSIALACCIMDKTSGGLTVLTLSVEKAKDKVAKAFARKGNKQPLSSDTKLTVRMTGVNHAPNVLDCCKIRDGDMSRLLVLTTTIDGRGELTLQAPWSVLVKVDIPSTLSVWNPRALNERAHKEPESQVVPEVTIEPDASFSVRSLEHATMQGRVDIVDNEGRKHRLEILLESRNIQVVKLIKTCQFALQNSGGAGDGILIGWWEVLKWLRLMGEDKDFSEDQLDWMAMVIVFFSMAVYFIEQKEPKSSSKTRKKKAGADADVPPAVESFQK
ncbi:Anaphase-promoting complex subunit 1, partial [Ascosphaera atra]